jgi:CDP-diacylglycerol pyrophosphatase
LISSRIFPIQTSSYQRYYVYNNKTNQYPSKTSNQWKSTTLGQDFITICPHDARSGDTFYIAVNCDKKCSFQIEARLEKEYVLTKNEELNLSLKKNEKKMFKFTTDSTELDKISVFSYSETFSDFQMYVAIGKWRP